MDEDRGRDQELAEALAAAHQAERRAEALSADARARIADADARSVDADAQTRHAKTGIAAADAHLEAARLHMAAANLRESDVQALQEKADEQMADAAAMLADAKDDSAEYQRALYHYTQLMRHRMANPLQIICGMTRTMLDQPEMEADQRMRMLASVHEQADMLRKVCLEPRIVDDVERGLHPRPFE